MRWKSFVLNGDVHTHVLTPIFIVHASQNRGTRHSVSDSMAVSTPVSFNLTGSRRK
jgi:hypothetical protein